MAVDEPTREPAAETSGTVEAQAESATADSPGTSTDAPELSTEGSAERDADEADESATAASATESSASEDSSEGSESEIDDASSAQSVPTPAPETVKEADSSDAVPHAEARPVVATSAASNAGPVHDVLLHVGLSDGIELPDLKARLIVARLQALGDVQGIDPSLDSLEDVKPPITLNIRIRSTTEDSDLVESLDLEGVASVEVAHCRTCAPGPRAAKDARTTPGMPRPLPSETAAKSAVTHTTPAVRLPRPNGARTRGRARRSVSESIDSTD